ncbi:MAG TPA: alpha-amylase family glycosyl hydrolase [Candidatus Rifleibacterium sp.]|nr:alpha-amylase family glycosyl hydrolase [Candidatus Rifleibacterium sp.]HPT47482.1 alpha-amylase family glycosyl hydrolase [Candidatus Rifleibacterium sp.]
MTHPLLGNQGIRLYNLYPRLVGSMSKWAEQLDHIKDMGFNAIWVNPFHYPGFSGSLYSPKDYYKFNPMFIDNGASKAPTEQLRDFISACHNHGILFIMDLVINHTAIDCQLIQEHPDWYRHDASGKVLNPGAMHDGKWVTWGDLAEVDNENSKDRQNLWNFWWKMMAYYLEMGVDGFRCDMAYQVPAPLWNFLIDKSRQNRPGCLFLAESLGCDFKQVQELAKHGFDYLFNSVKYWDFNAPWGMEQYYKTSPLTPSIAFPESHDTARLISELNGDLAAVKRQILFSALFSKGYMITTGFEYGFRKSLNVVKTDPTWWEETEIDLSDYLRKIAALKQKFDVLNIETGLEIVDQANWPNVFCFKRSQPGMKTLFVILNKDRCNNQNVFIPDVTAITGPGSCVDVSLDFELGTVPRCLNYTLHPSEIKIIAQA